MTRLKLGLIGSGYVGKTNSVGFATEERRFSFRVVFEPEAIADVTAAMAGMARQSFGFAWATTDWRDLVRHPGNAEVDFTAAPAMAINSWWRRSCAPRKRIHGSRRSRHEGS